MSDRRVELLDVVALLQDLPERGLVKGQVGTVVEDLGSAFEVEFSVEDGRAYALLALRPADVLLLHHRPVRAA